MDVILAALDAAMNEQAKKNQGARPSAQPVQVPPPVTPRATAPATPVQPAPPAAAPHPAVSAQHSMLQGMFADGNSLLRAIIAAEVLGPPVALGEHHFWNLQPNEPSI